MFNAMFTITRCFFIIREGLKKIKKVIIITFGSDPPKKSDNQFYGNKTNFLALLKKYQAHHSKCWPFSGK